MSETNRSNKRMIRIGATAVIVAIAAVAGSYLIAGVHERYDKVLPFILLERRIA
ncbi:hypothetical protein D3C72_290220 [compost metagenome]